MRQFHRHKTTILLLLRSARIDRYRPFDISNVHVTSSRGLSISGRSTLMQRFTLYFNNYLSYFYFVIIFLNNTEIMCQVFFTL